MFDFIVQNIDCNFRRSSSIHLSVYLLKRYFYTIFLVFHNMIVIHKSSWNPSEYSVHLFSLLLSGLITVLFFKFVWCFTCLYAVHIFFLSFSNIWIFFFKVPRGSSTGRVVQFHESQAIFQISEGIFDTGRKY